MNLMLDLLTNFFDERFGATLTNVLHMKENTFIFGNPVEVSSRNALLQQLLYSIKDEQIFMINEWQAFTTCLFFIGLGGFFFNRTHIILTLIAGELLILAAFLNFIFGAYHHNDPTGYIYASILLAIAACEAALGLSLVINLFKVKKSVALHSITYLHG